MGFATSFSSSTCKVYFSPLGLNGCQTVEWQVSPFTGPPLGTTVGNQSFAYTFSGPGTYNIRMLVTQKKGDGSLCEIFAKTQTVTVTCGPMAPTGDPLIKNSSFSLTPVAGGLAAGGSAPGWMAAAGDPVLISGVPDSQDGWGMAISGNSSYSDVLASVETVCLPASENGILTLRVRTWGDPHVSEGDGKGKLWKDPKKGKMTIQLGSGQGNGCTGTNCYNLATLTDFLPFETDEWYEVRIPYNLSSWGTSESCGKGVGKIPVRILISISNPFTDSQGDGYTRDAVLIDNTSFNSLSTGIELPDFQEGMMRLYPNPTSGNFTLEMAQAPAAGTVLRIIKPSGQVVMERQAEAGECIHTFESQSMPAGLYFVQVLTNGKLVGVEKLVRQ